MGCFGVERMCRLQTRQWHYGSFKIQMRKTGFASCGRRCNRFSTR